MRSLIAALLLSLALGCERSEVAVEPPGSYEAQDTTEAEVDIADSPHHQVLDEILVGMIREDYRENGATRLQRMDAVSLFARQPNIKGPFEPNPNNPRLEWRLAYATTEPEPESLAGWSFIKGRWEAKPDESFRYVSVPRKFGELAPSVVTSEEDSELADTAIRLAEQSEAGSESKVLRSEPVVLESGYRVMVEFRRAPEGIDPPFRELLIKFAPDELPGR